MYRFKKYANFIATFRSLSLAKIFFDTHALMESLWKRDFCYFFFGGVYLDTDDGDLGEKIKRKIKFNIHTLQANLLLRVIEIETLCVSI